MIACFSPRWFAPGDTAGNLCQRQVADRRSARSFWLGLWMWEWVWRGAAWVLSEDAHILRTALARSNSHAACEERARARGSASDARANRGRGVISVAAMPVKAERTEFETVHPEDEGSGSSISQLC